MSTPIPDDQFQKLTSAAQIAGYPDVSAFINALAEDAETVAGSHVSEANLAESESIIARGEADLAAGRTQDMREAFLDLGVKRGYVREE